MGIRTTTTVQDTISLAFWNARGDLKTKRDEIGDFLALHHIDILLIQETFLRPSVNFKLANFDVHRDDRTTHRGGGTAILVRRGLSHHKIPTPPLQHTEATIISLHSTGLGQLNIASVYHPPSKQLLHSDLQQLFQYNTPTIAAGDFNSKHPDWGSRTFNSNGSSLKAYTEQQVMQVISSGEWTYVPTNPHFHPDILDVAVLHQMGFTWNIHTEHQLTSDHWPTILEIQNTNSKKILTTHTRIHWNTFEVLAHTTIDTSRHIETKEDIVEAITHLTQDISSLIQQSTEALPEKRNPFSLPLSLRHLIAKKNRVRSAWTHHKNTALLFAYKTLRNLTKKKLQIHNSERWYAKLEEMAESPAEMWKMTKKLRKTQVYTPPLPSPTGTPLSDLEKAEIFASTLEGQFQPVSTDIDTSHVQEVDSTVAAYLQDEDPTSPLPHVLDGPQKGLQFDYSPVTASDIKSLIDLMPRKKSPGADGVTPAVLKHLPGFILVYLAAIFTKSLELGFFPDAWKSATVRPILKKDGNPSQPTDYRPISLLSCFGKLLEKLFKKKMEIFIAERKIIQPEQFGFRRNLSTTHQLLRLVESISEGLNNREDTGAVFLDVSKAFDKVWHQGLIYKMIHLNFPRWMIKFTASFLTDRSFSVKIGQDISRPRPIESGVPQGSVLGPLLFTLYTQDLSTTEGTRLALFADDTAIYARSRSHQLIGRRLQSSLDAMSLWFRKWRLQLNERKTQGIMFTPKKKIACQEMTLNNTNIPWSNTVKYLGLTLDSRLTWKHHIEAKIKKAKATLFALLPLCRWSSRFNPRCKLLIYRQVVIPQLLYGCQVWGIASKATLKKLHTFHNVSLRMLTKARRYVPNKTIQRMSNVPAIDEIIKELTTKFYENLESHENQLVLDMIAYELDVRQRHLRPRHILWKPP